MVLRTEGGENPTFMSYLKSQRAYKKLDKIVESGKLFTVKLIFLKKSTRYL